MKQIPNLFTLLNLLFGCLAIVCIMQTGLTLAPQPDGEDLVMIPERIYMASLFIGLAALIDFFDGFTARLLKVSSDIGKQLDSLADVVSFGVAPGLIAYQFLRLCFAQQENGLDINALWLLPALLLPCAGAYRLARFNIDTTQRNGFAGVPIPAAGLLVASFPLIYWNTSQLWVVKLLLNKWFWYLLVVVLSYLMVSTLPMMALKFKALSFKKLWPFILLAGIAVAGALLIGWLTVPVTFIAYVILSLSLKLQES